MFLKISPYQIVLGVLVLGFASQVLIGQRPLLPLTRIEIAMLLFAFVAVLSKFTAGTIEAKGEGLKIANLFNGFLFPYLIFFLAKHLIDSEAKLIRVFLFLLGLGTYLSVTAVGEMVPALNGLVFPKYILDPMVGIHFGRARGPFLNAAADGTVLGMLFPLGLYVCMSAKLPGLVRRLAQGATALLPLGVYLSATRACWIGALGSAGVLAVFYPKVRKWLGVGVVLVLVLGVGKLLTRGEEETRLTQMDPVYSRMHIYNASWRMLADRPLLGVGFDNFPFVSPHYFTSLKGIPYNADTIVAHDTFLGLLVELGVLGFLPLAFIFFSLFTTSRRLYQALPRDGLLGRNLVVIFWSLGAAFLINMQFIDMRYFVFPNALFFLLAGTVIGLAQRFPGRAPEPPAAAAAGA